MITLKANWNYDGNSEKRHYLVKAIRQRKVIGRAHGWFSPNKSFVLEKIELSEQYRSRGYGTAIVEELRSTARANGCSKFVFSGVRPDNLGAIKLYKSLKAVPVGNQDEIHEFVLTPP